MRNTLYGYRYKGQPIYEEWSENGLVLKWLSRKFEQTPMGLKFKEVYLHSIRFEALEKEHMSNDPERTSKVVARVVEGREMVYTCVGVAKS